MTLALSVVIGQARFLDMGELGGTRVKIPACAVTADELKRQLELRLEKPQYSIQVSIGLLRSTEVTSSDFVPAQEKSILGYTPPPRQAERTPFVETSIALLPQC